MTTLNPHVPTASYGSPGDPYAAARALLHKEPDRLADALALLHQAIAAGDARARYALASWHLAGNAVVERDEVKGVDLLKTLRTSHIAEALFDLALAYDGGKGGVRRNEKAAFALYYQAALLGDTESCAQMAQFYAGGWVVPRNRALAKAWKERAAQDETSISPPHRVWL